MNKHEFNTFRLVGGTSLSLQYGHRESIDIDLFTDEAYVSIDFKKLENRLHKTFPYVDKTSVGEVVFGRSYFCRNKSRQCTKTRYLLYRTFCVSHSCRLKIQEV
ncbi:nucleotidyl transferase AbiEii/AbiGii toxin family protein [Wenyingzhuangia sp. chi5]|uniref:Nucleotidyl transferase AbiEii/AbiGii toxin family protein n=1 Tax=Wenyingzhuangia gilva TaxID=3057677 RepID=A0ABT8VRZ7_9FLAO|nr:nucleotidyl transferase AbiEii/AbiGii toxin family protein [Wenyingzhuangia sp. chi5]MDO3694735.1 nucleotidyl transferase AbiEii/AbiGii toxin family protein [Wenyingzhuangia sp. chi5]